MIEIFGQVKQMVLKQFELFHIESSVGAVIDVSTGDSKKPLTHKVKSTSTVPAPDVVSLRGEPPRRHRTVQAGLGRLTFLRSLLLGIRRYYHCVEK